MLTDDEISDIIFAHLRKDAGSFARAIETKVIDKLGIDIEEAQCHHASRVMNDDELSRLAKFISEHTSPDMPTDTEILFMADAEGITEGDEHCIAFARSLLTAYALPLRK